MAIGSGLGTQRLPGYGQYGPLLVHDTTKSGDYQARSKQGHGAHGFLLASDTRNAAIAMVQSPKSMHGCLAFV